MFKTKTNIRNQNSTQNNSEISENLIKQVNYLQEVIGNKEVENLINNGVINNKTSLMSVESIIKNNKKKEEYEAEHIKKDRKAIIEEAEQKLMDKKDKAASLLQGAPGTHVYANVKINLVYAEIPGEPSSLFYHYTDLVDVNLSSMNINRKDIPQKIKRGEIRPEIFSFRYELPEESSEQTEEEPEDPEAKTEKEEKPGTTKAPPTGKKDTEENTKEYVKTILNKPGKEKKG